MKIKRSFFCFSKLLMFISIYGLLLPHCKSNQESVKQAKLEFRAAQKDSVVNFIRMRISKTGDVLYVHPSTDLDQSSLTDAQAENMGEQYVVRLTFNQDGQNKLNELTVQNIGKHVGILIDGVLVSAPLVRAPLTDGVALIVGGFSEQEAENLAARLKASIK